MHFSRNRPLRICCAILLAMFVGGCTVVGPDYQPQAEPALPAQWNAADAAVAANTASQWWQQFHDPVLDTLIDRGGRQNLSLEAAGLRIVQARAALGISEALIFPQQQQLSGNLGKLYRDEHSFNFVGVGLAWLKRHCIRSFFSLAQ